MRRPLLVALLAATSFTTACVDTEPSLERSAQAVDMPTAPATPPASAEPALYPGDGQCGFTRERNGSTLGVPQLQQNHCGAGQVCGRPDSGAAGCTAYNAETIVCDCVPEADVCAPAAIVAGYTDPSYQQRVNAEARALECCAADLDSTRRSAWHEAIWTAIAANANGIDAEPRHERVERACPVSGTCGANVSWGPVAGDSNADGNALMVGDCKVDPLRNRCTSEYRATKRWQRGNGPFDECLCDCVYEVGPPAR